MFIFNDVIFWNFENESEYLSPTYLRGLLSQVHVSYNLSKLRPDKDPLDQVRSIGNDKTDIFN